MTALLQRSPLKSKLSENASNAYRLLYRGALSLPDSHLLLDGITFTARLDSPSKHNHLLQNPLALALESMRGRPSIRFIGVINLNERGIWLDESGGVEMDIHPYAALTRIYFENIFCLTPFVSASVSSSKLSSSIGVKVAVGDTDGPETTEMVIYTRPSDQDSKSLNLLVARLSSHPPPALHKSIARIPRPDDPTPRKPMAVFGTGKRDLKRMPSTSALSKELKRAASSSSLVPAPKRKKLVEGGAAELGSSARVGVKKVDALFKIPEVPAAKIKGKGKAKEVEGLDDVFGSAVSTRVQGRSGSNREEDGTDNELGVERANKNVSGPDTVVSLSLSHDFQHLQVIKRCTLSHLQRTKDPTLSQLPKAHPDFKDLFGWIYRGVCFALRSEIKIKSLNGKTIERLVQVHTDMYVGGHGGTVVTGVDR